MANPNDNVYQGFEMVDPWKNKHEQDANKSTELEADMSGNITKTELEALLKANKSEVDVVAANMREEMSKWREEQNEQMSRVITTLSVLDVKLDERYENQKSSTSKTQWLVGLAIAVAALAPAIIGAFKTDAPQQPTVIYVQQPAQQQTLEPPKPQPSNSN